MYSEREIGEDTTLQVGWVLKLHETELSTLCTTVFSSVQGNNNIIKYEQLQSVQNWSCR